jgi:hypothetical protein
MAHNSRGRGNIAGRLFQVVQSGRPAADAARDGELGENMSSLTPGQRARAIRAVVEGMESRRLLSAAVISSVDAVGARIAGNVFNDLNNSSSRDSGEPGLANISVKLTPLPQGTGEPITRLTNSLGQYAFEGVPAGRYLVTETVQTGWTQTKPLNGYELTVTDGQNVGDENFGQHQNEPPPPPADSAQINGRVFNDLNHNGVRDTGEPGLAGVTVTLKQGDSADSFRTFVTGTSGEYGFANLPAGSYHVTETVLSGYSVTVPIGNKYDVMLATGQIAGGKIFGQYKAETPPPPADTARINGRVFKDLNAKGVRDTGEPGLAGVTVTLSGEGGVRTLTTPTSGEYSFINLPAGSYTLSQAVLSGYVATAPGSGTYSVTLSQGQIVGDKIFGQKHKEEVTRYNISGKVWNDSDNDGVFDSTESVSGIRTVYIDANNNGAFDSGERSVQSASNGEYVFTGLLPGTYRVSRVMPSNFHLTNGTNGGPNVVVTVTNANRPGINLGSAENRVTPPPTATATIGGVLFNDADGDGIWDDGESRSGIRTVFIDTNGNKKLDAGERSTQSNSEGRYSFTGLTAGTYRITRVFPDGYKLSNNNDGFVTVTVTAGQNKTNVNLGSKLIT